MKGELWRYSRRLLSNELMLSNEQMGADDHFKSTILALKLMENRISASDVREANTLDEILMTARALQVCWDTFCRLCTCSHAQKLSHTYTWCLSRAGVLRPLVPVLILEAQGGQVVGAGGEPHASSGVWPSQQERAQGQREAGQMEILKEIVSKLDRQQAMLERHGEELEAVKAALRMASTVDKTDALAATISSEEADSLPDRAAAVSAALARSRERLSMRGMLNGFGNE